MLRTWPTTTSHEDLFVERYARLLQWSLKLANGDRQLAEDIVHDAFVQFTLGRPDLDGINNLDGYLYSSLRNRFLSHVRRSARFPIERLSAADYDSAEISLRMSDPRTLMQVHEELFLICRYACERKATSKAGSVLILRFIHAYYPSEIALIMKTSRQAIDVWIRLARSEAKLYLESPQKLIALRSVPMRNGTQPDSREEDSILDVLRHETLTYRNEECPPAKRLEAIYGGKADETVSCKLLAHIVSCPPCLQAVGTLLGLAPPADRYPTDTPGPWQPPGKSPRPAAQLKASRRRAAEILDQHPSRLVILVNGFFIGAQAVSSEISELTLSIHVDERIGFVDILSEQGLVLLSLDIEPPPEGPVEQTAQIDLSGERSLQARLTFLAAQPTLQVAYRDPHFLEAGAPDAAIEEDLADEKRKTEIAPEPLSEKLPACRLSPAPPAIPFPRYQALLQRLRLSLNLGFWLRPGSITAILTTIVVIAVLLRTGTHTVSASQLLAQAEIAESSFLNSPGTVIHRSIALEEKNLSSGGVSRKRIEVWQSSTDQATSRRVRRLYGESGKLEAGELTRTDDSRILYRYGRGSEVSAPVDPFQTDLDGIWRLDMSARGFSAIVGEMARARVDQNSTSYVISYLVADRERGSGLLRASLTIAKSDLRAVQQQFLVERESAQFEYSFIESGIERLPAASAPPDAFQPGAEMVLPESQRGLDEDVSPRPATPSSSASTSSLAASSDLEVEVAYLLDRVNATAGEQIAVTRTQDGRLLVSGIVDTDRRKREILEALGPVRSNRALRIDVSTVAEAMRRGSPSSKGTTQRLELSESSTIPVYADLQAYLSRRGVASEQIGDEISRLSTRVLTLSRTALSHAWALRRLAAQFKPDAAQALGPEAQEKRLSMLRSHAIGLSQQTERLRSELQSIFGSLGATSGEASALKDESDLMLAIESVAEQATANDRAVQSAFTISANGTQVSNLRSAKFFESLKRVENLAARIAEFKK